MEQCLHMYMYIVLVHVLMKVIMQYTFPPILNDDNTPKNPGKNRQGSKETWM